ncbi:YggT family protein [Leucothrix pacifica]|uniref:YggT family protein n=1 Tax=Leucothrix pacifica TaxID=1247513 RepID=A0A317C2V5_9GAMM|nr:YggT family protein [Leucothrix pacifica]PWQ93016.1 YggT family protein [Leucothrix pacifica]
MSVIQQIGLFLVETLLSLYISAVVIRFLLGYARADFYNPLSQFLVKITNPVLVPVRRFVPSIGKLDTSAVAVAFVLIIIKVLLIAAIVGVSANIVSLIWLAVGELIRSVIWVYIIALILMAVISWIGSSHGNPVAPLVNSLVSPLVTPVRRRMPPVGMLDLSPMVVMIGLYILLIIVNGVFPRLF